MSSDDTLASRLRHKLESGELTKEEYDDLFNKFTKLGILDSNQKAKHKSPNVSGSGINRLKGGKVNGNVNLNGTVEIENSLECHRLSVLGTTTVRGDLTVLETTIVSGEMIVDGTAKFVDKISVSGRLFVDDSVYSLKTASLSGKTTITGDLITEGKTLISARFSANNIKSTGSVRIDSKTNVYEDILADKLEIDGGKISIGGSIRANEISIFPQIRASKTAKSNDDVDPVDSVTELVSNVVNVVFPTLIDSFKGILDLNPSSITVNGNIEGEKIDISNATIMGDIVGSDIFIGPQVKVNGIIKYRKSVEVPPDGNYTIEKLES